MRSGSTFVGEIFNNHPNAFYQFEPLHEFYQFGCDAKTDLKYESLLGQGYPNHDQRNAQTRVSQTYSDRSVRGSLSKTN